MLDEGKGIEDVAVRFGVSVLTGVVYISCVNELRLGYARTQPFTFQSDFGTHAADSLGIRGINVTEFTTFVAVRRDIAKEAMRRAQHKLPIKTRFITREAGEF